MSEFKVEGYVVYKYLYSREGIFKVIGRVVDGLVWLQSENRFYRIHERADYLCTATNEEIKAGRRL